MKYDDSLKEIAIIPDEVVMSKIYLIRGVKVMLDRDLAELYGVENEISEKTGKKKCITLSGRLYVPAYRSGV